MQEDKANFSQERGIGTREKTICTAAVPFEAHPHNLRKSPAFPTSKRQGGDLRKTFSTGTGHSSERPSDVERK